jgi:hypothetical protein
LLLLLLVVLLVVVVLVVVVLVVVLLLVLLVVVLLLVCRCRTEPRRSRPPQGPRYHRTAESALGPAPRRRASRSARPSRTG